MTERGRRLDTLDVIARHSGFDVPFTLTNEVTHFYGYDAFGNTIARSGTTFNNLLYCGEQFDSDLGLYFLRARYLDTERGRFWTMDPFEGVGVDPFSLHKYLYARSSPAAFNDPLGYLSLSEIFTVVELVGVLALVLDVIHPPPTVGLKWEGSMEASGGSIGPFFFGVGGVRFEFHLTSAPFEHPGGGVSSETVAVEAWTFMIFGGATFPSSFMPVLSLAGSVEVRTPDERKEHFQGAAHIGAAGVVVGPIGAGIQSLRIGNAGGTWSGSFSITGPMISVGISVFMGWSNLF